MTIIYSSKPLKERVSHDFYPTPIEICRASIIEYTRGILNTNTTKLVLDPGAGDGVWGKAFTKYHNKLFGYKYEITGVELRDCSQPTYRDQWYNKVPYYDCWYNNTDFLTWESEKKFDIILGNPPYKYAEKFLFKCFDLLAPGGTLFFLLRLSFLESKRRYKLLYSKCPPVYVSVSTRRISFTGNQKSDNTAYAIYYWEKGYDGQLWNVGDSTLKWLDWDYDDLTDSENVV